MTTNIARHRTALTRYELSKPLKSAIQDSVLAEGNTLFDYGCGKGDDLRELGELGYQARGWDPYFSPRTKQVPANVVNLGYVLNVIEDPSERAQALQKAFGLAEQVAVVSVMLDSASNRASAARAHGDGHITGRNTFQKYFTQQEIREYIRDTLGVEPIAADLGIFYVFKQETVREEFLQNRRRKRIQFGRRVKLTLAERYEIHRELLEEFVNTVYLLGRTPLQDEFGRAAELREKIGTFKKAFGIVHALFPDNLIEQRKQIRYNELLTQMALSRFYGRPKQTRYLPPAVIRDVKSFFGNYKQATQLGDELLFSAGKPEVVDQACAAAPLGKLLPGALYIHREYLEQLDPVLQVYAGCATMLAGDVPEANLVKLGRNKKKVSFLCYPEFDSKPHPVLVRSVKVDLGLRDVEEWDFSERENPPVLHRKELFVAEEYPQYESFKALSEKEDEIGLLEHSYQIGTREKWEERLAEKGYGFRAGKLIKKKK